MCILQQNIESWQFFTTPAILVYKLTYGLNQPEAQVQCIQEQNQSNHFYVSSQQMKLFLTSVREATSPDTVQILEW